MDTPPERTFPLTLPERALADREAMAIVQSLRRVRLPTKWTELREWSDLVQDYIRQVLATEGEQAFEDTPQRKALLVRHRRVSGEQQVRLSRSAWRQLRKQAGAQGFLETRDGKQYLVRVFETPKGRLLEVGLSWNGQAGPLVDEWREELAAKLAARRATPPLLPEVAEEEERQAHALQIWQDGRRVMELILGQVSAQRARRITIPAEAFRTLLWPDQAPSGTYPEQWKRHVNDILESLRQMDFCFRHGKTDQGFGCFLGEWFYQGAGPGSHGDGHYILDVQPGFLGCLKVFESGAQLFDFAKELNQEDWATIQQRGGYLVFDAGRPLYNSAARFTSYQDNLVRWLDAQLTKQSDPSRQAPPADPTKPSKPPKRAGRNRPHPTNQPRLYTADFCPLLPPGQWVGALGHFRRSPESGFSLAGVDNRASRHVAGLLAEMGYRLPRGRWTDRKKRILEQALQDIQTVVVDHFQGVVVGRLKDQWLRLDQMRQLPLQTLCNRVKFYCFLPPDYRARHRAHFEQVTGYRVDTGALPTEPPIEQNAFQGLPLLDRIREMMIRRKISGAQLALQVGVSRMTISRWLRGKSPIPPVFQQRLEQWLETGHPPSLPDLPGRQTGRQTGGKAGPPPPDVTSH